MMKRNKLRLGIMAKVWLAIMLIVVAVIGAIWLFQVVFLEDYYLRMKAKDFRKIVAEAQAAVSEKGLVDSQQALLSLAGEHGLCIDVNSSFGEEIVTYEGLPYNCYIHQGSGNRLEVLSSYFNQEPRSMLADSKQGKQYFVQTAEADGGYLVIVTQALAPVQEAADVVRDQLMLISLFLIGVATAVAFFVARSITRPVTQLSYAAQEIAAGNNDVRVEIRSNDEIGDLGENFNRMSHEIAKVNLLQRELVANISHDIRTPLTMIRGYAETIKDITGENKPMREQQLDIIVDEVDHLSTLVNDVLDLSLLQAGRSPINPAPFPLTARLREILSRFQLLEQTRGFELRLEAERELWAFGDEVRIGQVVYNLVNNAVNHIGEVKRITLRVYFWEGAVRVEVADTGKGIAEEDLPLIWDRYYKPYRKTEQKAMGTGLGLSIVKAVLIAHGSRFGVQSALGVGSTFWFTLPLADEVPRGRVRLGGS